MKTRPRVFKDGPTWAVELPAFGFSPQTVHGGFASREDAGGWLAQRHNRGSSAICERATTLRSKWAGQNIPVVYR